MAVLLAILKTAIRWRGIYCLSLTPILQKSLVIGLLFFQLYSQVLLFTGQRLQNTSGEF